MSRLKKNVLKFLIIFTLVFVSCSLVLGAFAQSNDNFFHYTIKKGDTLYLLANRFNSSIDKIFSMNPESVPDNLKIGSKLKIAAGKGITIHPLKKGDTLWKISKKHNTNINSIVEKNYIDNPDLIYAGDILAIPEQGAQIDVMTQSKHVVNLLKGRDFQGVSRYVHPTKGVRFSPYAFVEIKSDLVFSASKVSKFSSDTKKYTWGVYDGTGDPIILTPSQYFERFVYRKDFAAADQVSLNRIIGTGNTLENQFTVYPKSNIVEYYIPGTEYYGYMDWQSLRLVFEKYKDKWYLTGIIHNEWTT